MHANHNTTFFENFQKVKISEIFKIFTKFSSNLKKLKFALIFEMVKHKNFKKYFKIS